MNGLVIDNFAGGGGASTGIEAALGRPVDIAINHDEAAIAVHAANHPATKHYCQSIYSVDPMDATEGRPVALIWFSPDCKHHSKAKGGKPRDKNIRDLANVVPHWIERLKKATRGTGQPKVILLENVEEFRQWGPLDDKGMPIKERRGEEFDLWVRHIRKLGYKVEWRELRACDYGAPTSRKRLFLVARCDGLPIVWPAPTHGQPDSAEVARASCCRSAPPPSASTGRGPARRSSGARSRWPRRPSAASRPASCATSSIRPAVHRAGHAQRRHPRPFRRRAAADHHHRQPRRARGGGAGRCAHRTHERRQQGQAASTSRSRADATVTASQDSASSPCISRQWRTATSPSTSRCTRRRDRLQEGSRREQPHQAPQQLHRPGDRRAAPHDHSGLALAALTATSPRTMVQMGYGEREGQDPRALDVEAPLGTVVAGGNKHAAVAAFLHKYRPDSDGAPADGPMPTVTANSFVKRGGGAPPLAVTSAHLEQANTGMVGHDMRKPVSTIVGKGCTQRLVETTLVEEGTLPPEMMDSAVRVAAFLVKYYGSEVGQHQALDAPLDTATVKPRFAVVTVTIDAVTFVLVDIGMRMLEPRELANAQGFPPDYILDPTCWYLTDSGAGNTARCPRRTRSRRSATRSARSWPRF
jgi:DNA (cytosine-5)-methyltransferase 1